MNGEGSSFINKTNEHQPLCESDALEIIPSSHQLYRVNVTKPGLLFFN